MPFYAGLQDAPRRQVTRTIDGIERLRARLDAEIPPRNLESTLLLATWNIREFDSPRFGSRLTEAYYYLAEVINRFDLVAVQEVRRDLEALRRLADILGWPWRYLVTDTTEGAAGNDERIAFLYDSRKVRFGGLAGELVLPPLSDGTPVAQIARTPYIVGFRAGWTDFVLAAVHIRYGTDHALDPARVAEIRQVARFLRLRAQEREAWSQNLVVLGDFNIFNRGDETMTALTDEGWVVPPELQTIPGTNVARNKHYDQIALRPRRQRFETTGRAGVFDPFEVAFRLEDETEYEAAMGEAYRTKRTGEPRTKTERRAYYRQWRTHQISDHLPMWIEIRIDYSKEYLSGRRAEAEAPELSAPTRSG
jgi:hypothetical protein